MALVKVKPTSPGRRAVVKVVSPVCIKASLMPGLWRSRITRPGATIKAALPPATWEAVISSIIVWWISAVIRMVLLPRSSGWNTIPNRSANLALLCYADGERRYIIAPSGMAPEPIDERCGCADQERKCVAPAQYSGRQHNSLRGNDARERCATGPFCWHVGTASGT